VPHNPQSGSRSRHVLAVRGAGTQERPSPPFTVRVEAAERSSSRSTHRRALARRSDSGLSGTVIVTRLPVHGSRTVRVILGTSRDRPRSLPEDLPGRCDLEATKVPRNQPGTHEGSSGGPLDAIVEGDPGRAFSPSPFGSRFHRRTSFRWWRRKLIEFGRVTLMYRKRHLFVKSNYPCFSAPGRVQLTIHLQPQG
jgi:hypothetical protein